MINGKRLIDVENNPNCDRSYVYLSKKKKSYILKVSKWFDIYVLNINFARELENYEGYEKLANAIVIQAYYDYKKALKRKNKCEKESIERFFYSEFYMLLTSINPNYLMNNAKREVRRKCQKVKHGKTRQ